MLGRSATLESKLKEHLAILTRAYHLGVIIDAVNIAFAQPPIELVDWEQIEGKTETKGVTGKSNGQQKELFE